MESLGDDMLLLISKKIHNVHDRRSFYRVSKQILKFACVRLRQLDMGLLEFLKDILPASSNIWSFKYKKRLSNTYMELLARSCPNLHQLRLSLVEEMDPHKEDNEASEFEFDFDDDGLCVVANACSRLNEVDLSGRLRVSDVGVAFLVRSCKDLTHLNLSGCESVTDESLKSIGELNSLRHLCLGCSKLSDVGLEYMAKGNLQKFLVKLKMDKCDNFSDVGISFLKLMNNLTDLKLSNCGLNITNSGIVSISQIRIIEHLNVSWLINQSDISLSPSMVSLRCGKAITREGVLCFSNHRTLKSLVLFSCPNISWKDVKLVASTCKCLIYIGLSRRIKTPMPKEAIQNFYWGNKWVMIIWK